MTPKQFKRLLNNWLRGRPPQIQRLAERFPFQSLLDVKGKPYFVVGWAESNTAIMTRRWNIKSTFAPGVLLA